MSQLKVFRPFGPVSYELKGTEAAIRIFGELWRQASHFAVVNPFLPVLDGPEIGTKKLKRVQRACRNFPCLQLVEQAYWATAWPGTVDHHPPALLLHGRVETNFYTMMFGQSKGIFWEEQKGWEDLMLFSESTLMFYVCTHERVGEIIGPITLFSTLTLSPTAPLLQDEWVIRGDLIPPVVLKRLLEP